MNLSSQRFQRRTLWLNPLVQLGFAAVICVITPYLAQVASLPMGWHAKEARNTAWAVLFAIAIALWLHRSVSNLPGMRQSSGILPAHLASFGLILVIILLARIDYSRANLILGFGLSVAWFFIVYVVTQRRTTLAVGLVDGGRVDWFDTMPGVVSVRLLPEQWPVGLDAVAADFRHDHSDYWEARLADFTLAGIPVYHSKDLYESLTGRVELEQLSENKFGALGPVTTLLVMKRIIDLVVALPALIILSPVLLMTAVAIKLDSPGPALFRQSRVGYRGKEFLVIKFRTMRAVGDKETSTIPDGVESCITKENDARITRIGRFLRRSRIDELPQIINILKGEMSWIGPRPEALPLAQWYEAEIPYYRYRHVVRTGITGWAQVNQGHVAEISDIRTKLQYDFYYIRNFSIWLDLVIVMKTIKIMLTGFGHR